MAIAQSPEPRRPISIILWLVLAAFALGLFVALSWNAWARYPAASVGPSPTPTPSPTAIVSATPSNVTAAGVDTQTPEPLFATVEAVVLAALTALPTPTPAPSPHLPETATAVAQIVATAMSSAGGAQVRTDNLALWISAVSAITALLGLVSTVLMNWRKERREAAQARAELAKTLLEVEKLRKELQA